MGIIKQLRQKMKPYVEALPEIFNYQIATKIFISIWIFLLGRIFQALLRSSGRVAVTSGDWKFLFTTWQGLAILLLGLISLFIYVAFDLNSKIVLSRQILTGKKVSLIECIREGFFSIGKFFNLRGIAVSLYIALIAPIIGVGVSISLTEGLYIPTFISSFIESSLLYSILAGIVALIFLSIGIANLFILHGMIIDNMSIQKASRQSRKLIEANWKDYLKQNILFIPVAAIILALVAIVFIYIPLRLIAVLSLPASVKRALTVFVVVTGAVISVLADLFSTPLYLLKMTQLYYSYKQGRRYEFAAREKESHTAHKIAAVIGASVMLAGVYFMTDNFDQVFPEDTDVKVIAHRGGGNEGNENTESGLKAAWKAGAYGSEIDIQRTKDGYYVVNHDGDFARVADESRKPEEMTLKEVKMLSVGGDPVPTYEEMLSTSKDRLILFTELKGNTADKQMADDAVRIVKQYHMEDQCVLISLKYDLIDYIETNYPEIQTGFLTFASFGKTAKLNCDYLGLEEESATKDAIDAIHKEGKKVLVWTANEKDSQKHFLCTEVDGLITDNVSQAINLNHELEHRSDLDRIVDKIKTML